MALAGLLIVILILRQLLKSSQKTINQRNCRVLKCEMSVAMAIHSFSDHLGHGVILNWDSMIVRRLLVAFVILPIFSLFGCSEAKVAPEPSTQITTPTSTSPTGGGYGFPGQDKVNFKDDVEPKGDSPAGLSDITFTEIDGQKRKLNEYISDDVNNVLLVVTRGYGSSICLYCATQTSRLIANYDKFKDRKTEVVVAFPVESKDDSSKVSELTDKAIEFTDVKPDAIPFSVLLDVELAAVNKLGIKDALAKPATYIIDRNGDVRFAYVGSSITDRPSIKSLLKQIETLNDELPKPTTKDDSDDSSSPEAKPTDETKSGETETPTKSKTQES